MYYKMKDRIQQLKKEYEGARERDEIKRITLTKSLFDKLVEPACFNLCAKTDIDIVFLNEMECTYKWMITYKQAFNHVKNLE